MSRPPGREGLFIPAAILLGCLALAGRPGSLAGVAAISVTVGVIGLVGTPRGHTVHRASRARWVIALLLGTLAFAAARGLRPGIPDMPAASGAFLAVAVASVAEEAFFRRLVYGWLAAWGPMTAIAGAAVLFAAVHLPAYGTDTLPLNVAAALVFGWQRWATGGWSAPALTHLAANFLQMG